MRPFALLAATLAILPGAFAADQMTSAIVWFEDVSTPDSVVEEAKKIMIEAGAKITHMYTIIQGFSVIAPEAALESVRTWSTQSTDSHKIRVEKDEEVSSL